MEIMKQMRDSESVKTDVQHKLLDQVYQNNLGSRESQLQLELAIAKMNSDSESKMLQANAQMELEKIRHATQMQMSKMKHELSTTEGSKEDDPFSGAMQKYLQRKLQIDMIKELNMESEDGGLSTSSILSFVKSLLTDGGPALLQLLSGKTGSVTPTTKGRLVNPSPAPPPPAPPPSPPPQEEYEEDTSEESADYYGADPSAEIPKVAAFFEYVKNAIDTGSATPEEAAKEAIDKLSPPIVDYLSQVETSEEVIKQLAPLLSSMYGDDFVVFFEKESTIKWMNKMLNSLSSEEAPEEGVTEPKSKPESEPEPESKAEPELNESEPNPEPETEVKRKPRKRKARARKVTNQGA